MPVGDASHCIGSIVMPLLMHPHARACLAFLLSGARGWWRLLSPHPTCTSRVSGYITVCENVGSWWLTSKIHRLREALYVVHIMDSHGLCNWYSQPMTRFLHNSYSSWRRLTPRFFLISYVGRQVAWPMYSASLIHEHQEEHETDWWTPSMHSIAY